MGGGGGGGGGRRRRAVGNKVNVNFNNLECFWFFVVENKLHAQNPDRRADGDSKN